jgi:hypothetical protein
MTVKHKEIEVGLGLTSYRERERSRFPNVRLSATPIALNEDNQHGAGGKQWFSLLIISAAQV